MKIKHISDTHCHPFPKIEGYDIVIHSGDGSNNKNPYLNEKELFNFIEDFSKVKSKYKIYVPGNHDTSLEKGLIIKKDFENAGITLLISESIEIEGFKIWGSPYTPTFGDWAYMKARNKLDKVWNNIPIDTDIIVVHGPCKGILDLSYDKKGVLEYCGDNALKKRVLKIEPTLFLCGHIHNCKDIINAGYIKLSNYKTIFSNGSMVTDGKFGTYTSLGNEFEIFK